MAGSIRRGLGLPKVAGEERESALQQPGPTWREWFFRSFLKSWIGLGFLIVDSWIFVSLLTPAYWPAEAPAVGAAVYAEFLLFRFLWFRPDPEQEGPGAPFRRSVWRLTRYGRWTAEYERVRAGLPASEGTAGPDPREFL
jgi:hypothetical protein